MDGQISRARFLRGRVNDRSTPRRPPWALDEAAFLALCDRCGKCLRACPDAVLQVGDGGYPEMDFARGGCSFCAACVEACPGAALTAAGPAPWSIRARFAPNCLSLQGVICRLCEESCAQRAIRFTPLYGGLAMPKVASEACDGCGACVSACPTRAIDMTEPET